MKTTLACIPCFVRQVDEAMRLCGIEDARGADIMRQLLREIADSDWNEAPVFINREHTSRITDNMGGRQGITTVSAPEINHHITGFQPDLAQKIRPVRSLPLFRVAAGSRVKRVKYALKSAF